jgi:hypothetical protein
MKQIGYFLIASDYSLSYFFYPHQLTVQSLSDIPLVDPYIVEKISYLTPKKVPSFLFETQTQVLSYSSFSFLFDTSYLSSQLFFSYNREGRILWRWSFPCEGNVGNWRWVKREENLKDCWKTYVPRVSRLGDRGKKSAKGVRVQAGCGSIGRRWRIGLFSCIYVYIVENK